MGHARTHFIRLHQYRQHLFLKLGLTMSLTYHAIAALAQATWNPSRSLYVTFEETHKLLVHYIGHLTYRPYIRIILYVLQDANGDGELAVATEKQVFYSFGNCQ